MNTDTDKRMRRRRASRLADANADPGQRKLKRILGHAAGDGHGTPRGHGDGDDPGSAFTFSQHGERDAKKRIEHGESETGQQSDLHIRQAKLNPNVFTENADQRPINKVERVDHDQGKQHIGSIPGAALALDLSGRLRQTWFSRRIAHTFSSVRHTLNRLRGLLRASVPVSPDGECFLGFQFRHILIDGAHAVRGHS